MQTQEQKMTAESLIASCSAALLLLVGYAANTSATSASVGPAHGQITALYDAFGQTSAMQKDWGYAVLLEYGGKRILFDTGNKCILAQNAKAKDLDLSKLHFVVMSHRHGDHMGGWLTS
jgi:7,8-dihydropterin-6-yl-methyl-4-(beta-D-ribofuranosyl)aminobenzene 5'-phosphate synthase